MTEIAETRWMGNMAFEATIDGFPVRMDTTPGLGGTGFGPRPKPMILSSLAGCTGMDVVSILSKSKVPFIELKIEVSGDLSEQHPKYYQTIRIVYHFWGPGFSGNTDILTKITRAVELSGGKYCGVSAMLKNSCDISYAIQLHNSE